MFKLLSHLYLAALVLSSPTSWATDDMDTAHDASHAQFVPRPQVHSPQRGNLRLTSVLRAGGEPYPGSRFTILRDQPGTFGESRATVMAVAGPKAFAEFELTPDRYRVQVRNGAVTTEQPLVLPRHGVVDTEIVLNAAELQLSASMDAGGTVAAQAWFRILRRDTDSYGRPVLIQVASDGYADTSSFVLPAGDYLAEASYGDASVQRELTVHAGEQRRLDLLLDAGRLDLHSTLGDGDTPASGVDFTLLRRTGDPSTPFVEVATADTASSVSFILPSGDYVARAELDQASAEAEVTIGAGQTTTLELPLRAGEVLVYATLAGRKDALLDSWFTLADRGGGRAAGDTTERGPDHLVRFVLPAGEHRLLARHGGSSGSATVVVEPGSSQTLAVDLDAGRVSVRLTTGQAALAQPFTWFSVYRIERDDAGRERRERVYHDGYHATTDIVLPAGEYIAFARTDRHRGERGFVITPGSSLSVDIPASR